MAITPPTINPGDTWTDQYVAYQGGGHEKGTYASYRIQMAPGRTYVISTSNAQGADPWLYLLTINADGTDGPIVAGNSEGNGPPGTIEAKMDFETFSPQTYTLKLRAATPDFQITEGHCTVAVTAGDWSNVFGWGSNPLDPVVAIHLHVLPDGKVLSWPSNTNEADGTSLGPTISTLWDPKSPIRMAPESFTTTPPAPSNVFCSGHAFLPDGRLLITGGHINNLGGLDDTNAYDFATNTWSPEAPMNAGRWYPTNTALADGDMLVISGAIDSATNLNRVPQVWTGSGWLSLDGATWETELPLPLYPFMHLAPNGMVFYAGPVGPSRYLDTTHPGAWTDDDGGADPDNVVAQHVYPGWRDGGSSVLYDDGKVLVLGGDGADPNPGMPPPTATAEVIDLISGSLSWRFVSPMAWPRRHQNAVLLPDGKVLVVGGTYKRDIDASGAVLAAELWDPATEIWATLPSMTQNRLYDSTAILLPDASVLVAGGGEPFGQNEVNDHPNAEIFFPNYLFDDTGFAPRPEIRGVVGGTSVTYGSAFLVDTAQAEDIASVTWIRLPSTTHSFDQNQRINRLAFKVVKVQGVNYLQVTAPSSRSLCPPGHYMLFILNSSRVPSEATIMKIS